MKVILANSIRDILESDKLHILNLYKGNEKCFQGELYANLSLIQDVPVALEYPIGRNQHADIAVFKYFDYQSLKTVIELKHYSVHQSKSEEVVLKNIKEDVNKRLSNGISNIYGIHILTQITNVENTSNLQDYPFTATYAKSYKNSNQKDYLVKNIFDKVKSNLDKNVIHIVSEKTVDSKISIKIHALICGPFS